LIRALLQDFPLAAFSGIHPFPQRIVPICRDLVPTKAKERFCGTLILSKYRTANTPFFVDEAQNLQPISEESTNSIGNARDS
jgi:hypothetical protein